MQPSLAKVYSQAKYSNELKSGEDAGQSLDEKQSGKLSCIYFWVQLAL
jgi:hypothetical protein